MAENKKISELEEINTNSFLSADDEFVFVDKSITTGPDASTTGKTSKVTLEKLTASVLAVGNPGADGEKGDKGDTGDVGSDGTDGQKGERGVTGANGSQGQKGNTGAAGDIGSQGLKGNTGTTGGTGSQGLKGIPGNTGIQGQKGQKGQGGTTGGTGSQGLKGNTGATGSSGSPWGGGTFSGLVNFSSAGIGGTFSQPNLEDKPGVHVEGQLQAGLTTQDGTRWGLMEVNPYNPNHEVRNEGLFRANGNNIALTQYTIASGGVPNQRHFNCSLQTENNMGVFKMEYGTDAGIINAGFFKFWNNGSFTAPGTKNFRIDHPILPNKELSHTAIEGPRADLIYRGRIQLENGNAVVNIDASGNMTDGTFVALTKHEAAQVYLQTENSFDLVKGEIIGNEVHVESNNAESSVYVSWMVVSERADDAYMNAADFDENGNYVTELDKVESQTTQLLSSLNDNFSTEEL